MKCDTLDLIKWGNQCIYFLASLLLILYLTYSFLDGICSSSTDRKVQKHHSPKEYNIAHTHTQRTTIMQDQVCIIIP